MRKYGRVDKPHRDIVAALRKAGCSVLSLSSIGGGAPDLLVARNQRLALCELKDGSKPPSARQLTEDQKKFIAAWKSPVFLLSSVDDAVRLANAMT